MAQDEGTGTGKAGAGGAAGKGETTQAKQSRQSQAIMRELNRQGITNLDDLMRQVLADTSGDEDVLAQKARKLVCTKAGYCFVIKR